MKKENRNSYYGTRTTARDGVEYRSQLEADFVNKFLFGKGLAYEYEKEYPNTKFRCDFYLSDLDIWIELTYHKIQEAKVWETKSMVELPMAKYDHRNHIKSCGGCWNPRKKIWYVIKSEKNKPLITKLERYMDPKDKKKVILSKKSISEVYNETLSKKIQLNNSVIVVDREEVDKHKNLASVFISKKNKICISKLVRGYFDVKANSVRMPVASPLPGIRDSK